MSQLEAESELRLVLGTKLGISGTIIQNAHHWTTQPFMYWTCCYAADYYRTVQDDNGLSVSMRQYKVLRVQNNAAVVAQWSAHPTGNLGVPGSVPLWGGDFLCKCLSLGH